MPRIVILGGGLAGAACALHFLRDHPGIEAELCVVEPRGVLGAGLAYSTPAPEHRINVAAARMSLFPEEPLHFDAWARAQGVTQDDPASEMPDGRLYPARAVFGRYAQAMLKAEVARSPNVRFSHVRAAACGVAASGTGFSVALEAVAPVQADALVLAMSHTAPDVPAVLRDLPGLIRNPWDVGALRAVAREARVLIVGTGLTSCDVVASLLAQGHRGALIAVSRHGLLPRPRTPKPVEAEGDFATAPETSATALLMRIRRAMAVAQAGGRPWENIVDALRQQACVAWGSLDWRERGRLLRHLRTYWDVHRFQSAPQIDAAIARAREAGQFSVRAAALVSAQAQGGEVVVKVRPRGARPGVTETLLVDTVINCTGPGHRSVVATHPVLRGLAEAGDLQADPVRLGILVDAQSRVIRADGRAWRNLFVAGPLARGTHGELMGLPQVNLQPRAVAHGLALVAQAA